EMIGKIADVGDKVRDGDMHKIHNMIEAYAVNDIADHFIIIGVVILLIDTFRQPQSEPENTPADAESNNEMPSISTEIS
ncbi:MAG: hypothetical protein AAFR67_06260, partial [Chloroflexota bacterium]